MADNQLDAPLSDEERARLYPHSRARPLQEGDRALTLQPVEIVRINSQQAYVYFPNLHFSCRLPLDALMSADPTYDPPATPTPENNDHDRN